MPNEYLNNMFGAWLMDNCKKTDYNRARTRWAVIGDPYGDNEDSLISQITEDLQTYIYTRNNAKNLTADFLLEYYKMNPGAKNNEIPFK